jgi:hypothetical protein
MKFHRAAVGRAFLRSVHDPVLYKSASKLIGGKSAEVHAKPGP